MHPNFLQLRQSTRYAPFIQSASPTTAKLTSRIIRLARPAARGNSAAVLLLSMSRHPNRYRGAYDYNHTYGDYDFVDRGAWSSPEHAYDEYDPRAGRTTRTSPTNSQVQSAYADYYTEPRDCYSAPSSSQTDANYNRAEGQQWRQDPGSAYQGTSNYYHSQITRVKVLMLSEP